MRASPAPEENENDELQEEELAKGVRKRPIPCDLCSRRGRICVDKGGRACLPCKERRVACSHVVKPPKEVTAGNHVESDTQLPDTRASHILTKRLRSPPATDSQPGVSSNSAGPSAQTGVRILKGKVKVSHGAGARSLSAPGGKRARVVRNEDREGDPFSSDEEEFMKAARASMTISSREKEAEAEAGAENYPNTLSAEDGARFLDRLRALEENARDIVGEISTLQTYFCL
ncbi:hypothetical protein B0F90DRAFT_1726235 [Multifurca ochricompacta]|uniref:Zn(2)-C6 fungal-type domain-containing protein n=1 Tax=Multifurca ochricompacta TaxID=376703 RepID=A0AAD4QN44_9AGAM|nr:hypothetical protein B0F90DRAFT_1726235 [Multifurca ochricompacta]